MFSIKQYTELSLNLKTLFYTLLFRIFTALNDVELAVHFFFSNPKQY